MKSGSRLGMIISVFLMAIALGLLVFTLYVSNREIEMTPIQEIQEGNAALVSEYLTAVEDEPDTVDFQRTSIHYTVAQNVFNRLVEAENDENGNIMILPSLADSWKISDDRLSYTFHLHKDVVFSNGSPLTSSDVEYTLIRLLTHPESCNADIAMSIKGAADLQHGRALNLDGFEIINDLDFTITLSEPFEAFLACMSMPGASILDRETVEKVGDRFGMDPESTIGTGSFILKKWVPEEGMLLVANEKCWAGAPRCPGLDLRFLNDAETVRMLFEDGGLDVLDLDEVSSSSEFFINGDIYQNRLYKVQQIGTTYIALNESVDVLSDVRVRKALQMSLNRSVLMDAVYSGRGTIENGIYAHGLYGFNPDLPEIPYDPDAARELLREAGYADGFDLTASVKSSSTRAEMTLMSLAVNMWNEIGIRANVQVLDESEFMRLRKAGELACYTATWIADYDDPDNFIYTFFGNRENTVFRSLCYPDEAVMQRVRLARGIPDADERIREYRELERKIVQEDAAWIPLFSRLRYYVVSERLNGFKVSWNGSVKNNYRNMSLQ